MTKTVSGPPPLLLRADTTKFAAAMARAQEQVARMNAMPASLLLRMDRGPLADITARQMRRRRLCRTRQIQ